MSLNWNSERKLNWPFAFIVAAYAIWGGACFLGILWVVTLALRACAVVISGVPW